MPEPASTTPFPERRRSVLSAVSSARLSLLGAIGLSIITLIAVLAVLILSPANAGMVTLLLQIMGPLIAALLGASGFGVLKVIDGHQSQLMAAIAQKERAEAFLAGLRENPQTNLAPIPPPPPAPPEGGS